jgi:hypothetical protein
MRPAAQQLTQRWVIRRTWHPGQAAKSAQLRHRWRVIANESALEIGKMSKRAGAAVPTGVCDNGY